MVSNRLKSISSLINKGEDITDIGCDHALLDIYLTLNKNCCCHCCDVSQSIIDKAISNIKKSNLDGSIDVFVGNGFNDLNLDFKQLNELKPIYRDDKFLVGNVIYIDHFGNVVTNTTLFTNSNALI